MNRKKEREDKSGLFVISNGKCFRNGSWVCRYANSEHPFRNDLSAQPEFEEHLQSVSRGIDIVIGEKKDEHTDDAYPDFAGDRQAENTQQKVRRDNEHDAERDEVYAEDEQAFGCFTHFTSPLFNPRYISVPKFSLGTRVQSIY